MDTLSELISYLVANLNYAGEDVDVFRHITPDEPSNVTVVVPYGGSSTPLFTDTSTKKYQINVRRHKHSDAYNECKRIQKVLRSSSSVYIKLDSMDCPIAFLDEPFKLKIDEKNRVVYAFNISITSKN